VCMLHLSTRPSWARVKGRGLPVPSAVAGPASGPLPLLLATWIPGWSGAGGASSSLSCAANVQGGDVPGDCGTQWLMLVRGVHVTCLSNISS
jgi:hypothetical protein